MLLIGQASQVPYGTRLHIDGARSAVRSSAVSTKMTHDTTEVTLGASV